MPSRDLANLPGGPELIADAVSDPLFPYLVAFPRTGSHWLRALVERVLDRPTLVRVFFLHDRHDWLFIHDHDDGLTLRRKRVIYLYRNPVQVVFSQMGYHGDDWSDENKVSYWAERYGEHLYKWLVTENFASDKAVVCYEYMLDAVRAVAAFCWLPWGTEEETLLAKAIKELNRVKIAGLIEDNPKIMSVGPEYEVARGKFRKLQSRLVWETVMRNRPELGIWF
jgi:hypothetical protein